MNNELVCFIDMFSSECEVVYPDSIKESAPTLGILKYLYDICKVEGIYNLHLYGNETYINGLIQQNSPLEYGCGKVEIKVN